MVLRVHGLTLGYGGPEPVLADFDLTLKPGEFIQGPLARINHNSRLYVVTVSAGGMPGVSALAAHSKCYEVSC